MAKNKSESTVNQILGKWANSIYDQNIIYELRTPLLDFVLFSQFGHISKIVFSDTC